MMATTSTIGTARAALVAAMNTGELKDNVFYAWPGPDAERNELVWISQIREWEQDDPLIKAGRRHRQERYVFEVTLLVAKPELNAGGAQATFERALVLFGLIEDAIANAHQLGTTAIQRAQIIDIEAEEAPMERGWAFVLTFGVECHARLT